MKKRWFLVLGVYLLGLATIPGIVATSRLWRNASISESEPVRNMAGTPVDDVEEFDATQFRELMVGLIKAGYPDRINEVEEQLARMETDLQGEMVYLMVISEEFPNTPAAQKAKQILDTIQTASVSTR